MTEKTSKKSTSCEVLGNKNRILLFSILSLIIISAGSFALYSCLPSAEEKLAEMGITDYDSAILNADDPETLELLIEAGADVNIENRYGFTPLYLAACAGHSECVKLLLAAPGIDVSDRSLVTLAVMQNDVSTVKTLILSHPDSNALYWAASLGHTECLKLLLAAPGIDVNLLQGNDTPLSIAVEHGHTECVKLLLAAPGIDVNTTKWEENLSEFARSKMFEAYGTFRTPLAKAAIAGHTECVKLLLTAPGIDVNIKDRHGNTPLHEAASAGHTECVKLLLTAPGIDVNIENRYGYTPLDMATSAGHTECVKLLRAALEN